jgi:hypothetical protein
VALVWIQPVWDHLEADDRRGPSVLETPTHELEHLIAEHHVLPGIAVGAEDDVVSSKLLEGL